jgi:inosine/xanthosine triphosphatase
MLVVVGSKNEVKIHAVKETLTEYPLFEWVKILWVDVSSWVSPQPKTLKETLQGAMNRAKSAFESQENSYCGIGLESGLMEVPYTKTGFMDTSACAIYDWTTFHLWLSSAFEYPIEVTKLVFEKGIDITQAFNATGLSKNEKLGSAEGAIGLLTQGRVTRKDYTRQSITMALIHLENPELY